MPLIYDPGVTEGALRQGEILRNIWAHRSVTSRETEAPDFRSFHHVLAVILTADCDLLQDFNIRFAGQSAPTQPITEPERENLPAIVPYTLLCELFQQRQVRDRGDGLRSDIWRRVMQNQDERYHSLPMPPGIDDVGGEPSSVVVDFKKMFTIPTEALYEGILAGDVQRLALIPPIYIHDLMHRFYGFLSRVGID